MIISIVADRNKGFALGAAAVMQKPISRQELYESLVDLGSVSALAGPDAQGARRRRRSQGGRADRRPHAGPGQHRAARVRRPRGDRDRAAGAAGPDRARSDDAGRERLRRRGGAQRTPRDGAHSDPGRHRQADHRRGPRQAERLRDDDHGKGRVRSATASRPKSGGPCPDARWSPDMAKSPDRRRQPRQHDAGGLPAASRPATPCSARRTPRPG